MSIRAGATTHQQRRLLEELTGRISPRLEATFQAAGDADGPNVGLELRERNVKVVIEIPRAMLELALADLTAREALRVRLKARRDRMLFKAPPAPLPKRIVPMSLAYDGGHGRAGQRGRGRR